MLVQACNTFVLNPRRAPNAWPEEVLTRQDKEEDAQENKGDLDYPHSVWKYVTIYVCVCARAYRMCK